MEVLKVGELFAGRYRVLRRLSEGGMGAVYVALQEATELQVALKVLWPHILQRSEAVERFALEAKISARIRSDHIVQVFDAGFDPETQMPFLVMELLQGATLQSLVEQGGPCAPADAVELLTQTARGLDRAHAYKDATGQPAPVIHRDLKPENIFVTRRETGEPLIKILDYGIAKILSQSTSLSREIKGTPLYMAYEQATGGPLSPQTDLWAFGLIAFFLLTGDNYWRSTRSQTSDLNTLITEIVALPLVSPSQRLKEFPSKVMMSEAFDKWFHRCVNRDPAARFASAGEAVKALAAALAEAPPVGGSIAPWVFDSTLIPQSRVAAALGSAPPTPAPHGLSPHTTMAPASVTQSAAQPVVSARSNGLLVAGAVGLIGVIGVAAFLLKESSEVATANEQEVPSADAPAALPPPMPAAPVSVTGSLRIEPVNAVVKVNGAVHAAQNGVVELIGLKDTVFNVEMVLGAQRQTTAVRLLESGLVEPATLKLPQDAVITRPTVRPVANTTPVTQPQAQPEPKPVSPPKPVVAPQQPAPKPPKETYNPLIGPRVVP